MWSDITAITDLCRSSTAGIAQHINKRALDILGASRFSGLFMSLALAGSLNIAFAVLVLGCLFPSARSSQAC